MATNKKQIKREINEAQEPLRDTAKDIPLLLACILKELETNNKYLKLVSQLKCMEHGRDV
jgi:uncharacterized protein YeeX (DUF496 family)